VPDNKNNLEIQKTARNCFTTTFQHGTFYWSVFRIENCIPWLYYFNTAISQVTGLPARLCAALQ